MQNVEIGTSVCISSLLKGGREDRGRKKGKNEGLVQRVKK